MEEGFLKIPKALFSDEYSEVSPTAKLLYGFLLERNCLSQRNNWRDKENEVYVYFSLKTIQELFSVSINTASALLGELKKAGLVEHRQTGVGRPNMIKLTNIRAQSEKKEKRQATKKQGAKNKNYDGMITYDIDEVEALFNRPLIV